MNRRNFLKTLFGLFSVPLMAYLPEIKSAPILEEALDAEFVSIDAVKRAAAKLRANGVPGPFTVHLHPDHVADLARLKWKDAYRTERIEQKRMAKSIMAEGIGRCDNFRFIVSESLT